MEDENTQGQAGEAQVELTEEEKVAKAEQEAADAKAKEEAEAAAANTSGEAHQASNSTGTVIEEGSIVSFTLALGEVRDAVVRAAHADGTLNVAIALTDEDLRYVPEEERDQKEIVRLDVKLGEAGVGVNTWSPKA